MTVAIVLLLLFTGGAERPPELPKGAPTGDHPKVRRFALQEPARDVWDDLADCESGEWVNRGESFIEGSADWDTSEGRFEGGLQFHPDTWDWLAPESFPEAAHHATIEEQKQVAQLVLERQGWVAWPVCSRLLGLRE